MTNLRSVPRRNKRAYFIISLGTLLIAASGVYIAHTQYLSVRQYEVYRIMRTKEGFNPQHISIHKGDAVIFLTSQYLPFWPASNNHPVHEIYPEFDPGKSISPTETWEFRFWNIGTWKYHDHLFGPIRGTITVLP